MFIRFCIKIVPILLVCYSYGNITDSLKLYSDLGLLNKKQGNLKFSEQHYKKALQFANDNDTKADLYNNLGIVYKKQGKYDLALDLYIKAERSTQENKILTLIYANIAVIQRIKGDFNKAILYNNKALNLVKNEKWKAAILNNMANVYYVKKEYKLALNSNYESLEIKKQFDPQNISYSYLNIALCLSALNNNTKAESYFIQAINEWERIFGKDDYQLILAYTNYGVSLTDKNPKKALESLLHANQLAILNYGEKHPGTAETFTYLGSYYLSEKHYKKALGYYQKALIANSKSFSNINFYLNPLPSESISELQQLKILHNKAIAFSRYVNTLEDNQKGLRMSLSTYELAIKTLFKLQNSFMDESKRTLIANKKDMFAEAAYVAIKLGDYPKAFQLIEKGKASTLLAAVNNNEAIKFSNIPDSLVDLEREYKRLQFVHAANDNTDSVLFYQARHDSLVSYFETNYKKYYKLKYNSGFIDPCEYLDTNQVLLEYVLTDTLCTTFIVTKDGYKQYSFLADSVFYNQLNIFINSLKNYDLNGNYIEQYRKYITSAYYLWEKLIAPLKIPYNKSLIIIPDGMISYVPFEALLYEKPPKKYRDYYGLKYLLNKHPVSYSYSSQWHISSSANSNSMRTAAFAIDYKEWNNLMTLPNTVPEAKKLTGFFKGTAFTNDECTKEVFLNNNANYNILHFSMHGDIDLENPMDSKLIFSGGDLFAWEVYGLNLNSRLAYLSACSTGDGKLDKGEGLFSMGRAFAYAGCPTIVISLWADKDMMSHVTTEFYKNVRKGFSLDKAMQQAKIKHIEQMFDAHPRFWANKIVMGNVNPMKRHNMYWILLIVIPLAIFVYRKRKN